MLMDDVSSLERNGVTDFCPKCSTRKSVQNYKKMRICSLYGNFFIKNRVFS